MRFDPEQTKAIEATGTNILVSASAGAGKTGVLVGRLSKRILRDHIPVSRILAMTFTQAAAAEMKKRLAQQLNTAYLEATDSEQKQWVGSQLIELESASITTIDSYCLTIIQKYCNVIGLNPAIYANILDEGKKKILQKTAYLEALAFFAENYPELTLRLLEYFSPRSEDYDSLYEIVCKINDNAQSDVNPDEWYEKAKNSYAHIRSLQDLNNEVKKSFFGYFLLKISQMQNHLLLMKSSLNEGEKVTPEKLLPYEHMLTNCINFLQEENYGMFVTSLQNLVYNATLANTKNAVYSEHRKAMEDILKKLLEICFDEKMLIQDHNDLTDLCALLVDLSEMSYRLFQEKKVENVSMDFSDMERYALDILNRNNGVIADIIRDSLDEIMVDEFQDTSFLQNEIIEKISNGKNVFRVGDVKQSIYRFRQAKPQLMRSLMDDPNTLQITLRHNYRSRQSIVGFTNLLFGKIMNIEGMKDTYLEKDSVSIGADYQKEEPVPVTFAMLMEKGEDEESFSGKQAKALWIAQKILSMKEENPSLSYRSFAILVKAHADKSIIRNAFDEYGIPYDIDAREGFYQSTLCQTILSMVRFMTDDTDMVSLASILTSTFYQLTDEELATLKIGNSSILEGVKRYHPEVLLEMDELRDIARNEGIMAMLKEIAYRHDFYNLLSSKQQANFDFLYEKIANASIDNLFSFLDILEAGEDEKSSEASAKGKDDDLVTVTTIHQSKGLQYKIVFLWATSRNDFADGRNQVLIDDTLMLGFHHLSFPNRTRRTTIQRIAVEHHANIEDLEEFTRLLYVAITRAEERLFIVDSIKKEFPIQEVSLALAANRKGMSGLILSALMKNALFERIEAQPIMAEKQEIMGSETVSHLPVFDVDIPLFPTIETPSMHEMKYLPDLDTSRRGGKRHGSLVHETIEKLPNKLWAMDDLEGTDLFVNDRQKILRFSNSDLYKECLNMEIHKEFPFFIAKENMRMSGVMDFVAIGDKKIIMIDFKTDNASVNEIVNRYIQQMEAYKKALQILYPAKQIEIYLWAFHHDHEIRNF